MSLSLPQRIVLLTGTVLLVLSFLFPCWAVSPIGVGVQYEMYKFILNDAGGFAIDYKILVIQECIIVLATIAVILAIKPRNASN
jgi:hypothetical protein